MAITAPKFIDASYLQLRQGTIDLDSDTIIAVLVNATQVGSVVNDLTFAQISANEIVDADYVKQLVANIAWTSPVSQQFKLDADAINFGAAVTIEAKWLYLVRRAAGAGGVTLASTDLVLAFIDLDNTSGTATGASVASTFQVDFNATNGILLETLT